PSVLQPWAISSILGIDIGSSAHRSLHELDDKRKTGVMVQMKGYQCLLRKLEDEPRRDRYGLRRYTLHKQWEDVLSPIP
ncbi:hypothetical protein, partial [Pseudomonas aeruginosa]|uniref:hypothetical protein n=1 Tax=Pseudomonas aeruginosa TaxID=287 RepID=UPI00197DAF17